MGRLSERLNRSRIGSRFPFRVCDRRAAPAILASADRGAVETDVVVASSRCGGSPPARRSFLATEIFRCFLPPLVLAWNLPGGSQRRTAAESSVRGHRAEAPERSSRRWRCSCWRR
ncbi:MAG TPA: hypothetical protein DCQ98_14975 [Planctomycetaceae bacterium]|nr:hypothetical protein [Planctomycetaceae bacterium]